MTILASAMSATDRVLQTVAALGIEANYPIPVLVDAESMIVTRQMARAGYQYRVERGQNGTAPVPHAANASVATYSGGGGSISATDGTTTVNATQLVFPTGTLADLGSGVVGVGLVARLLGPFTVTDADKDAIENGIQVAPIPAGTVVLQSLCIITELWAGMSAITLTVGLGAVADWGVIASFPIKTADYDQNIIGPATSWRPSVSSQGSIPLGDGTGNPPNIEAVPASIALQDGYLWITGFFTGTPNAGSADIYAVVVSPAT